jgi:hypothetical protein
MQISRRDLVDSRRNLQKSHAVFAMALLESSRFLKKAAPKTLVTLGLRRRNGTGPA